MAKPSPERAAGLETFFVTLRLVGSQTTSVACVTGSSQEMPQVHSVALAVSSPASRLPGVPPAGDAIFASFTTLHISASTLGTLIETVTGIVIVPPGGMITGPPVLQV